MFIQGISALSGSNNYKNNIAFEAKNIKSGSKILKESADTFERLKTSVKKAEDYDYPGDDDITGFDSDPNPFGWGSVQYG